MVKLPDYHPTFEGQLRAVLRSIEVLNLEIKELTELSSKEEFNKNILGLVDETKDVVNRLLVAAIAKKR